MPKHEEVEAAIAAFNKVRSEMGGIKTEEQQRYAMNEALDAVDKVRKEAADQYRKSVDDLNHMNDKGEIPKVDLPPRCEFCGWPLADDRSKGCVYGDCSYRPDDPAEKQRIRERRAALGT